MRRWRFSEAFMLFAQFKTLVGQKNWQNTPIIIQTNK